MIDVQQVCRDNGEIPKERHRREKASQSKLNLKSILRAY